MDLVQPWVLHVYDKELDGLLKKNLLHPSDLDRFLEYRFRIVRQNQRKLSHVAQTLTMLLQSGANWNSDTLLDNQKTPCHIICESEGDHHELLDLMIKSSQKGIINTLDIYKHTALMHAVRNTNINCIKILIEKGAPLDINGFYQHCLWPEIARLGNIELLKCMFNHGLNKNSTDECGLSVLWYVVYSDNIEAVRYLLQLGVAIPNYVPDVHETQCDRCKDKMLIISGDKWEDHEIRDPCMRSICNNKLEIVKSLDEYGSPSYKSFDALRRAVIHGKVARVSYLLKKYAYPLNIEYIIMKNGQNIYKQGFTFLSDPLLYLHADSITFQIIKLLLDHGADPAKQSCASTSANALMTAIQYGNTKVTVLYIRSGLYINLKSYERRHGKVLPFEAAVMRNYHDVAKTLLISGCSCGQFSLNSNREDKVDFKPELMELMKEWQVQENNVTPLMLRCRNVILNHLFPRADMKIEKLPLPQLLIKFLSISELDAM